MTLEDATVAKRKKKIELEENSLFKFHLYEAPRQRYLVYFFAPKRLCGFRLTSQNPWATFEGSIHLAKLGNSSARLDKTLSARSITENLASTSSYRSFILVLLFVPLSLLLQIQNIQKFVWVTIRKEREVEIWGKERIISNQIKCQPLSLSGMIRFHLYSIKKFLCYSFIVNQ